MRDLMSGRGTRGMRYVAKSLEKISFICEEGRKLHTICKSQGTYSKISYIVNREKNVLYLINAKVASSSIKASMLQLKKSDFSEDYNKVHIEALKYTKYIKEKKWFLNCYKKFFKFTFVRNPYERLVSCYENKYHTDRRSIGRTLAEYHFDSYPFGILKKDKGFTNFAIRLCLIPDKFADEHFRSQYFQLYTKDGECLVDCVGHFENIVNEYETISKKYGFDSLQHYNKATSEKWQDYYNPFTAWLVFERFKKDFIAFGYEREYYKLKKYLKKKRTFN